MEICDFAYHRPATLAEACALGLRHGRDARFLAGGTEILPDLKQHRDATQHIIDLNHFAELREIREDGRHLRIGALARLSDVAESPIVRARLPALREAILSMAAEQVRHRATLGGNFCGGVPSADTPPICIAAGAQVRIAGCEGERLLPAEAFFLGPRRIDLRTGEILAEVRIPIPPPDAGASYERFALRRATALAVASVAAWLRVSGGRIQQARVVLGAVAPVPLLAANCSEILSAREPAPGLFAEAAAAAAEEARPITDLRGSAEFRRELVRVLAHRALLAACARAREG